MEYSSIFEYELYFFRILRSENLIIYSIMKSSDLNSPFFFQRSFFLPPSLPLSLETDSTFARRVTGCQRPQKTEIPPAVFTRFITYRVNAEWLPVLRKLVPLISLVRAGSYRPDNGRTQSSRDVPRLAESRNAHLETS